jgi:hypothetical protein
VEREGIVERIVSDGAGSRWCDDFVMVRLPENTEAKICIEDGQSSEIRPEAAGLKRGDHVKVVIRRTFLGVSADLVTATNRQRSGTAIAGAERL